MGIGRPMHPATMAGPETCGGRGGLWRGMVRLEAEDGAHSKGRALSRGGAHMGGDGLKGEGHTGAAVGRLGSLTTVAAFGIEP